MITRKVWSWQLTRWVYHSLRKPRILALVNSMIAPQYQELEDVFLAILESRKGPSASSGFALDLWGRVFREPRRGRDDAAYQAALAAAVLVDRATGTPEEAITIVAAQVAAGARVLLVEVFPAKVGIWIQGTIPAGARAALPELVEGVIPGGVGLLAVIDQGDGARAYFGWDGDPDSGGWGTLADPAIGGSWSALI
jgi:hypothetical protein